LKKNPKQININYCLVNLGPDIKVTIRPSKSNRPKYGRSIMSEKKATIKHIVVEVNKAKVLQSSIIT